MGRPRVAESLVAALVERTGLTSVQLATLMAHHRGELEQLPLARQIGLRADRRVSKGAFLRTLRQAHRNIRRAAYTMLLLEATGYLASRDVEQFLRAGEIVQQVHSQALSSNSVTRVLATIEAVVNVIVAGSSEKPQIS